MSFRTCLCGVSSLAPSSRPHAASQQTTLSSFLAMSSHESRSPSPVDNEETVKKIKKPLSVQKSKDGKRGVIYLSSIAPGMNPARLKNILSPYGEILRTYLEPDKMRKGAVISYKEGWVEFRQKKVAKRVAEALNGSQIGGKRKAAYFDSLWTMKYLHRFKWHHLNEQMNLEKKMRDQRLRFEISRAKKEVEFYQDQVHEMKRRNMFGSEADTSHRESYYSKKQRATDEAIVAKKREKNSEPNPLEGNLLSRIFT